MAETGVTLHYTGTCSGDSRSGKQGGPAGVDLANRDTMIEVTPQCVSTGHAPPANFEE